MYAEGEYGAGAVAYFTIFTFPNLGEVKFQGIAISPTPYMPAPFYQSKCTEN